MNSIDYLLLYTMYKSMRRNVTGIFLVEMFGMTFEIEYENMYDARIPFNLLPLEHLERITIL